MSAFVHGYENDVFVSYADRDDIPNECDGGQKGWVTRLVALIDDELRRKLGRRGRIWIDQRWREGGPITPEVANTIHQSATLLVILSHAYIASESCALELAIFLEAVASSGDPKGRVFVVQRDEIPRANWPIGIEDLVGYEFFDRQGSAGAGRTLGISTLTTDHDALYFKRLVNLSSDLSVVLLETEGGADTSQAANHLEQPVPTVFLAEVTADLYSQRDDVARFLRQSGIRVVPESRYLYEPKWQDLAMQEDMKRSDLFVLLLSDAAGERSPDASRSMAHLQFENAKSNDLPILQWRHPSLELSSIVAPEQLALLKEPSVHATSLEEFKRTVAERVNLVATQPEAERGIPMVLLCTNSVDLSMTTAVAEHLTELDLGTYVSEERDVLGKRGEFFDASIVMYGECPLPWINSQLLQYRMLVSRSRSAPPVFAVYDGPPVGKPPLGIKLPGVMLINAREGLSPSTLNPFVREVQPS